MFRYLSSNQPTKPDPPLQPPRWTSVSQQIDFKRLVKSAVIGLGAHLRTQWNAFSSLWKNSSVGQPTSILF